MGMNISIARFFKIPAVKALRKSLQASEQDAVAYIAQLHQTGPGLYTAPRRRIDRVASGPRRMPWRGPDPLLDEG